MNRILYMLIACTLSTIISSAQNVGVGTRNPLSKLHVSGDVRIDSLAGKDSGLVMYNQNGVLRPLKLSGKKDDVLHGDGSFLPLNAETANAWLTSGNAGTDTSTHFIGTIDDKPLRLRVNDVNSGRIEPLNTAFGFRSLQSLTTGSGLIAIGSNALRSNTIGGNNIAIGNDAMYTNVGVKSFVGAELKQGISNIAVGTRALYANTLGQDNIAIGHGALSSNEWTDRNTAVGQRALTNNKSNASTAVGFEALYAYSGSGAFNVALGAYAQHEATFGYWNTALGSGTLFSNKEGFYNTAVGVSALYSSLTPYQTAVGAFALVYSTTGTRNTAVGYKALEHNLTGSANLALGHQSLIANTTGSSNVGVGLQALFKNKTGLSNTAVGTTSQNNNTSGVNNTSVGYGSLAQNISGNNNTAVGMYADVTSGNLTNATAIGYNAKVNASNKVRIGNSAVTKIEGQVPFSTPSDAKFKYDVKADVKGLDFILRLRPVTYRFDVSKFENENSPARHVSNFDASSIRRTGFIAQEVEQAAQNANYDFSGINKPESATDHYSLSYESFVVPLVKAVQEQQEMITNLQKTNQLLLQEIKNIKSQLKK